jgi:beta-phosphoglucomutase
MWSISNTSFDPARLHHKETIFTIGNGYLCTRGAFEEGYPGEQRATFIHGVFDAAPIVFTELANAPDWLPLSVYLNGERFSLDRGRIEDFAQSLDLRRGTLSRRVRWRSPGGCVATLEFERFASLADQHSLYLRCRVVPEFSGNIELRLGLDGHSDNRGFAHWRWLGQQQRGGSLVLHNRTRSSGIEAASAMRLCGVQGRELSRALWDVENAPTWQLVLEAQPGQEVRVDKHVAVVTSRDALAAGIGVVEAALSRLESAAGWDEALQAQAAAWEAEWDRTDVEIDGDPEAQIAVRFNLFQMLIAAPRHDDRVNIGAKTLSGFGYSGHAFWDTEIFMLPLFTYTAPHIARNLLDYRYRLLPQARAKAAANGFEGAQFPWESADTGEEVTPTWVPDFHDRTRLVRIWTGDIEIHISADIAYAVHQYWRVTGDDAWFAARGAELVLDTARFWASRAEWKAEAERYEYTDVIGPDEYHDHVDNNAFTSRMAQWNLQTALDVLDWLRQHAPERAAELTEQLDLTPARLDRWRDVINRVYLPVTPSGVREQFDGYFDRKAVDLAALEPRHRSVQSLFGIEGASDTQVIKQPDVLMLQYLLREHFSDDDVRVNYDYYTPRTDHTHGSSLGPAIQAIMACEVGLADDAYEHFIRAVRADLRDVRGNAGDGIHAASAAGTWQAVVFGFGGLQVTPGGWRARTRLPRHWKRLAFRFMHRGQPVRVELRPIRGFIFDLDGVLTDTAEYHYRGWKRLAEEEGLPFTREDNEQLRGVSRVDSLRLLVKERDYSPDRLAEMAARKNDYYLELISQISAADLLPGARELLEELRAAGFKIALGSASKNAATVVQRLGIAHLFDALADGNSVARQKPAPDLFVHAAAQLGLEPAECVVVEDAAAGIEAGRAGGFRTVGLGPPERAGQAEVVVPSLEGITAADLLRAL